ncbi:MAG: hypothetical protein H6746_19695 [Deltaproteobacteria bacterium]|nr:hypothetical protein [Deltaproteobacteria bacterium]
MDATMHNQLSVFVLTPKGELPAVLLDTHPGGLSVRVAAMTQRVGPELRLGFIMEGAQRARLQLLCSVVDLSHELNAVRLSLQARVLHSPDGKACMTEFLERILRRGGGGQIRGSESGGWYLDLRDDAAGPISRRFGEAGEHKERGALSKAERVAAERATSDLLHGMDSPTRRAQREVAESDWVAVRLGAALHAGGAMRPAGIYRLSVDGRHMELRTTGTALERFDSVALLTLVRVRLQSTRVFVTGTVSWAVQDSAGSGEVRFGLRLSGSVAPDLIECLREHAAAERGEDAALELATGTGD